MKDSVVVCAYWIERCNDVCEAVESVLSQTYEDIEIILVIDGNEALSERLQSEFAIKRRLRPTVTRKIRTSHTARHRGSS
jgi:glycosyltransferase involved in cell wall biosynthesis